MKLMDAQVTEDRRSDALDREAFEDMVQSAAFGRLFQRIQGALNSMQSQCERADDILSVRRAQGQVAALRMVLNLPQQILSEMRGRK